MRRGQQVCERDERGWRVPAAGTKSRMVYGLMVYGLAPSEIAREMDTTVTAVHQLASKITDPDWENELSHRRSTVTRIKIKATVRRVERLRRVASARTEADGSVSTVEEDLGWFMFLEGSNEGLYIGHEEETTVRAGQPASVTIELG